MKATAVKRILNSITEDAHAIDEKARKNGRESYTVYNVTFCTTNRAYNFPMDENSNWEIEDNTLWLETNNGTYWIDCDKIEGIEI